MFYAQMPIYAIMSAIFVPLCAAFVIICHKMYKDKPYEQRLKPIRWIFFMLITLEVVKIFLLIGDNMAFKPLRFPIVFCSIVMFAYPLFCFKQNRLSEVAKALSIIPSFIAFMMFAIYPNTLLTNNALGYFITTHTFLYHYAMLGATIYLLVSKIYSFKFKNYFSVFLALSAYLVMAASISIFIGGNISIFGPTSSYLGFLFNRIGYIPGCLALICLSFLLSLGLYALIGAFNGSLKKNSTKNLHN